MRRVRVFAAPFVITAALSGCKKADDDAASKPPPRARPDAAMSRNPPMPMPDARLISVNPPTPADAAVVIELPEVPKGTRVFEQGGLCYASTYAQVKCPEGGAPFLVPDKLAIELGTGSVSIYTQSLVCFREEPFECPDPGPGKAASCNPPAPAQVECPDELMPRLRDGLKAERGQDGKCRYDGVQVACP